MKKRIIFITLLFLITFNVSVFAIEFSDVSETDWFYSDIIALKEQKIISGYTDNTFKPFESITNAEALKMTMTVSNIDSNPRIENSHWASGYLIKAKELKIIPNIIDEEILDKKITRQEVADLIIKSLQLDKKDIKVTQNVFKDTDNKSVNILTSIGIINGIEKEDGRYFNPNNFITRAEMGAILVRLQNLNLPKEKSIQEYALELGLINPLNKEKSEFGLEPYSSEEMEKVLLYMASEGIYTYDIIYTSKNFSDISSAEYRNGLTETFKQLFAKYPEYFSFISSFKYSIIFNKNSIAVTLTLENDYFKMDEMVQMKEIFIRETTKKTIELIETKKIRQDMTEREKAKVLFEWVVANTSYDWDYKDVSYTGYGQIINKEAVCQGYTATYNYMCKLLGIEVEGVIGTVNDGYGHIWTLANLDGDKVYIDTTWGDSYKDGITPDYNYFAANSNFMKRTHSWDLE